MVRAVCHRIVSNRADAEDATQIALVAIVKALPRFDGRSKFSTWAYRVATNAALDEVRRIRRRPLPSEDPLAAASSVRRPAPVTRDGADSVESRMVIQEALALLPEEYRTAIVLRHIADLDYEEIAEILEVPVGTVRSRLSRGRMQLTEILGNRPDPSERQTQAGETLSPDPTDSEPYSPDRSTRQDRTSRQNPASRQGGGT